MATVRWATGFANLHIRDTDITEFDLEVARLKLQPHEFIGSTALRSWAKRNKNKRYVPEYLLEAWGESVLDDFDGVSGQFLSSAIGVS